MRSKVKHAAIAGLLSAFSLFTIGVPSFLGVETLPVEVAGVEPANGEAHICLGFNMQKSDFGFEYGTCPANHAFYGVDDPGGPRGPASRILTVMSCCPLPAKDILSEEHVYVPDECPENYIATGTMGSGQGESLKYLMRCTKINTARYQLGEARPAKYWGDGAAGWQGAGRIKWDNIPAGMRYAHGRQGAEEWDVDGCVGYPWGSLLTKKETKYCSGIYFRQLQFSGAEGDPASGTPVKMFADCDKIDNFDDPAGATCVKDNVVTAARPLPTNS